MPEKLRVLVLTERFHPEEFIINDLAAEWAAGDSTVDILTQVPSYPAGRVFKGYRNRLFSMESWRGMNIYRFFTVTGYRDSLALKLLSYFSFAVVGTLAALYLARRYDRIFVYQTGPLTLALPAVFARKLYGVPLVIWTQDIWPDTVYAYGFRKSFLLDKFLSTLIKFVYRNCDEVLVSSEGFVGRIKEYAPEKKPVCFPNWPTVVPNGDGEARSPFAGGFNFTFAGNIGKVQNLDNVIDGFALAVKEAPDIRLNIVGDGSHLEALKSRVESMAVPGVVFWGRKPLSDMPSFFGASDVMLISLADVPGLALTVPAKFQAYLAFSRPIFCVMKGEVRELVERHNTGLCSDPDDAVSIKDGFLKFRSLGAGGLSSFSARARELLEARYDRGRIIASIGGVVRGAVLAAAGGAGRC